MEKLIKDMLVSKGSKSSLSTKKLVRKPNTSVTINEEINMNQYLDSKIKNEDSVTQTPNCQTNLSKTLLIEKVILDYQKELQTL